MDPIALLSELIALPGPPGQEVAVREALAKHVDSLGLNHSTDAKGNLLVSLNRGKTPRIVVTAHMDEIAMIVRGVRSDGRVNVEPLGGLYPWKIGEGPVQILTKEGPIPAVLSFGSIHTAEPRATVRRAEAGALGWEHTHLETGVPGIWLARQGVRPGSRVVLGPDRRKLFNLGDLVCGFFLDDRADLVSWLLCLEELKKERMEVLFIASAAEEVGGEGALFALQKAQPDICIALELGPDVPDAPVEVSVQPTVWVNDSYSATAPKDLDLIAEVGSDLGMRLQYQALSRGGSDASCAASHGLCGRPITLGLPMHNSHGFEIMHPGAMEQLARLTVELVKRLSAAR